jgi:hypothetical protein
LTQGKSLTRRQVITAEATLVLSGAEGDRRKANVWGFPSSGVYRSTQTSAMLVTLACQLPLATLTRKQGWSSIRSLPLWWKFSAKAGAVRP